MAKDIKNYKYIPTNRWMTNQEAYLSRKKAFIAMGNKSEEDSEDEKIEKQSLFAIEKIDKYEFFALVAIT
ncbi:hypothetical protein H5410_030820 [Solanum commersonii]|uniref:Uncharacterized protein n=1 Tax=Solanum commersonii TaxID=4109 RepID=A0A9J5YGN9_SOLCO|nr:hypothetical protein H5410_030820 [Solanum commersonii]